MIFWDFLKKIGDYSVNCVYVYKIIDHPDLKVYTIYVWVLTLLVQTKWMST